jgi:hypothetical protein
MCLTLRSAKRIAIALISLISILLSLQTVPAAAQSGSDQENSDGFVPTQKYQVRALSN